jgi:hypothetical protein
VGSTGSGFAFGVAVAGGTAYVADLESGLQMVDIAHPGSPRVVAGVNPSSQASGVVVVAGQVCIAARETGLEIFPTRCDSGTPVLVTDVRAESEAEGIRILWRPVEPAFLAFCVERGTVAWSEDDVEYARLERHGPIPAEGPWEILDRDVEGGVPYTYRIAATTLDGTVLRFGPARAVWTGTGAAPGLRVTAAPNPSAGPVRVTVHVRPNMHERGESCVTIHDAAGREVRRLLDGVDPVTGIIEIVWDGRDDNGDPLPAGAYFVRYARPGETRTLRMILLP